MAKPPIDTYEKLLSFISIQLLKPKLANYQPVMIKTLLVNGARTRQEIAEELRRQNGSTRDIGHYMTVPVYRVLTDHEIVSSQGDRNPTFSLNLKTYSQQEFDELVRQLDLWIERSNTFLETGFLPLKDAKEKARKLAVEHNLKTSKDWDEFVKSGKKPDDIPSNPSQFYKKKNSS